MFTLRIPKFITSIVDTELNFFKKINVEQYKDYKKNKVAVDKSRFESCTKWYLDKFVNLSD